MHRLGQTPGVILLLAFALAALATPAETALANGTPIRIVLS
jgi:hypothetical protein